VREGLALEGVVAHLCSGCAFRECCVQQKLRYAPFRRIMHHYARCWLGLNCTCAALPHVVCWVEWYGLVCVAWLAYIDIFIIRPVTLHDLCVCVCVSV
jgi:hypothetical protein